MKLMVNFLVFNIFLRVEVLWQNSFVLAVDPWCLEKIVQKKNVISIRAGTVDQMNKIKPTNNIFMDRKVPSTIIDKKLKQPNRTLIT